MKPVIILALIGFAVSASALQAEPVLVSGIQIRGSSLSEPRPQKSKLLEVVNGGIVIMDDKAGFYLHVRLRKKTSKPFYAIIEYPNPADISIPMRNDADLPSDRGTIGFSSPDFVKGLKIGTDYIITVKIYEDRSAKVPIDSLSQTIRSHVDTTGRELRVDKGLKIASAPSPKIPEHWTFNFDGRKWMLGSAGANAQQSVREYILTGENIQSWTELVTSYFSPKPVKPRDLYEYFSQTMSKDCATLKIAVISEEPESIVFEWRHGGCQGYPPQHELKRIIRTDAGTCMLSYVKKTERLTDQEFSSWLAIIQAATPVK